jgi:N-methylhydantoinase B
MTNTRNTPVESMEAHYPLRVLEYSISQSAGGRGMFNGGDGIVKRIELLSDARVSLLTERRTVAPYGLNGGEPGKVGLNSLKLPGKSERNLPAKWSGDCPAGSIITIRTPGGGGFGSPGAR